MWRLIFFLNRKVTVEALNDSKYIGLSIYTVVILCVVGIPVTFILEGKVDAVFLIKSMLVILATTTTLLLVFVPKVSDSTSGNLYKILGTRLSLEQKYRFWSDHLNEGTRICPCEYFARTNHRNTELMLYNWKGDSRQTILKIMPFCCFLV